MAYSIGFGVLLEGEVFNEIRAIEMALADALGNLSGLIQPPHVTVKTPFTVPDLAGIRTAGSVMESVARRTKPFAIQLSGISSFAGNVIYLRVEPSPELKAMHEQYLAALEPLFPEARGPYEGEKIVFHSTLTVGLDPAQFAAAMAHLGREGIPDYRRVVPIEKVGLFLNVHEQWPVVHETGLSSS